MRSSLALDVFRRLAEQVAVVEDAAARAEIGGFPLAAPVLRRAGYVLAVAALDTYFHERAIPLLAAAARNNAVQAGAVANYCQSVNAQDVTGLSAESHIRLRLSYKTLVAPKAIDSMLAAAALNPLTVWRDVAFAMGSRPDRVQGQLQLVYDRRNQVAHEGDWDFIQLDFRAMDRTHLQDCVGFVGDLAEKIDAVL
ncbi:MAG: hypothetical protein JO079_00570 [Frankiaceae bacterium]|nr:hypothetical protein [Frankiaceae bacterium]MBV9369334.1 hypothetical protein [Frankiales bacterium]